MSSYLRIISCAESLPTDLSPIDLVLWALSNARESEIGSCTIDHVYLNLSELPYVIYDKFKGLVDRHTRSESGGSTVHIPHTLMYELWNEYTLVIQHQRLGPLNKEQWVEFCNKMTFYVYIS